MWSWVGACLLVTAATLALLRACRAAGHDRRRFLRELAEAVRRRDPEVAVLGVAASGPVAIVEARGQETPVPLQHAYERWLAFPDSIEAIADTLLERYVRDALDDPRDHLFADCADTILPQIRTREWLFARGPAFGDAAIAHRPLGDDLVVCYVIDDPWCMVFVTQAHLRQWGRREEDLYHLATRNLHILAGGEQVLEGDESEPLLLRSDDGYGAARLLLLDLGRVEGRLVAVPDRDELWIGPRGRFSRRLAARAARAAAAAAHPVSPHLYAVRGGELVRVGGGRALG